MGRVFLLDIAKKTCVKALLLGFILFGTTAVFGQTDLEKAAERGNTKRVAKMIADGVDVNATDQESLWERTPVIAAARKGHTKVVALLLEAGADPDPYDGAGGTALIRAIQGGHSNTVAQLLKHKANTERATDDGSNRTPLIWAILKNHEDMVDMLLKAGADPTAEFETFFSDPPTKKSCLAIAKERAKPEIIKLIELSLSK